MAAAPELVNLWAHVFAMKARAARTRHIDDLRLRADMIGVNSADAAPRIPRISTRTNPFPPEPAGARSSLLEDEPGPTGDERWDVLFAGLAEHLAMRDGKAAPRWSAPAG